MATLLSSSEIRKSLSVWDIFQISLLGPKQMALGQTQIIFLAKSNAFRASTKQPFGLKQRQRQEIRKPPYRRERERDAFSIFSSERERLMIYWRFLCVTKNVVSHTPMKIGQRTGICIESANNSSLRLLLMCTRPSVMILVNLAPELIRAFSPCQVVY